MNTYQRTKANLEQGQAIVLVALMMIGLIAIGGLAIDGGGLFFLYRDAQNATDAAVLAASYAMCQRGDPVAAGLEAARVNGFENRDGMRVEVNYPPVRGTEAGNPFFVEVLIEAPKPSYFIQVVYPEPLRVSTYSIGLCVPPFDPTTVPAIWAGNTTCNDTVDWTGSSGYIEGGVHSNNEIKFSGSNTEIVGPVNAVTDIQESNAGNVIWDPLNPPKKGVPVQPNPLTFFRLTDYAPGGRIASRVAANGKYTAITMDNYTSVADVAIRRGQLIWSPNKGTLEGLYYVEGNVDVGTGVNYGAKGVTIVATGEISVNSGPGADVRYYQEGTGTAADGTGADGLLFYAGHKASNCGENALKVSGSSSYFTGVVYAPWGAAEMSGSSTTLIGAILADQVEISGSSFTLIYDPELLPPIAPQVSIAE